MGIDELTGRELDAEVARRVFGLEVEMRTNARMGEKDAVCRKPGADWIRVAYYSYNMSASLELGYELERRGWKRKEERPNSGWNVPRDVRVVLEHADGRTLEAYGPVNVALCRAALKVVTLGGSE